MKSIGDVGIFHEQRAALFLVSLKLGELNRTADDDEGSDGIDEVSNEFLTDMSDPVRRNGRAGTEADGAVHFEDLVQMGD